MSSSYRSNYGPQSREPAQERRRQARTEDATTEAFIRKYMELAELALHESQTKPPTEKNAAPNRRQHYLELADVCLHRKGTAT